MLSEILPDWPCNRLIYESDGEESDLCPICGSSLKRRITFGWIMLFKTKFCIQPKCKNYWGKINA